MEAFDAVEKRDVEPRREEEVARSLLELWASVSLKRKPWWTAVDDESLSGLASAKSGARLWLADGLVPLFGAFRELVSEREVERGVQRGEAVCLRFRVAFGVVLGERVSGLRFLYNSYNSALVDLRGAWMSELDSACLKLVTVHFSIGGNAGLVDRYDDAVNWLVFSPEKARWSLGVLEDEWLGESRAVREKEPGA